MDSSDDLKLTDSSFFATGDPHAILARWRKDDPVHWTDGRLSRGFWSVTRHADTLYVLMNDNRVFSVQRYGACLPQAPDIEDEETSLFLRLLRSGANIAVMDGEPHSLLRKVFADKFSLQGIGQLEHIIRRCMREILDDVLPRGECDFVVDVAGRLPLAVISEMMDIPRSDWDDLYLWNNMSAAPEDPEWSIGTPLETGSAGTANLVGYCAKLGLERRGGSRDDLMTMLANSEIGGKPLSDDQLGSNGLMFLAAGHETTRASLSAALLELIGDPRQLETLRGKRKDPLAVATAAEEAVRWASPLTHTLRTAMEDIEIGGVKIREGDWVVPWFISANRDEDTFSDPRRFDAGRSPNDHLGFAKGKHHCLGAHLARAELRIALEYLLEEMPEFELAGDIQMTASNQFWGLKHMPIRFAAAPKSRWAA